MVAATPRAAVGVGASETKWSCRRRGACRRRRDCPGRRLLATRVQDTPRGQPSAYGGRPLTSRLGPPSSAEGLDADGAAPPSVYSIYAEGRPYADGARASAEGYLRRGHMPRAALGVCYADGDCCIRRGSRAVGVRVHSCSVPFCVV